MNNRNDSHFRQVAGNGLIRLVAGLLLAVGVLAGCSERADDDRPLVVATTTMLGDVAANIVGESARLEVLMPRGVDPHDYEPSSQEVALLAEADLVIANGLELEEGLEDVIAGVIDDGVRVLEVAPLLDPLPFGEDDHADEDDHDHSLDPHVWLDPLRMAQAARLIADELAKIDPSVDWSARADAYAAELEAADERIIAILASVPTDRRLLVTNHDAIGYFADRYGFEVVGVVIPGGSTLGEPGSQALADLVALIDELSVPAIFADTSEPGAVAAAVAAEAREPVAVVNLHTESLDAEGSPAATLIGMLEENARLIADALA
ncbi:MAG: metal ABC transporter substrate-binding protein [Acidimicrobiia bacterium]